MTDSPGLSPDSTFRLCGRRRRYVFLSTISYCLFFVIRFFARPRCRRIFMRIPLVLILSLLTDYAKTGAIRIYYKSWRFHSKQLIQTRHSRPWGGNRMACEKIPMRMRLSCVSDLCKAFLTLLFLRPGRKNAADNGAFFHCPERLDRIKHRRQTYPVCLNIG